MGRDQLPPSAIRLFKANSKGQKLEYHKATKARTIVNGYFRGWGLQFGDLSEQIEAEPLFRAARKAAYDHDIVFSILPEIRLKNMYYIISRDLVARDSYDVAEFGVYRGGTSVFLAYLLKELSPGSVVYGFDTFKGAPEISENCDLHCAGDFADTSLDAIECRMQQLGLTNFRPIIGDLCLDVKSDIFGNRELMLAHIDCDIHAAVRVAIDRVWETLCRGGYLVLDDADGSSCLGATQAMEEFIMKRHIFSEQAWPHFVFRKDNHAI